MTHFSTHCPRLHQWKTYTCVCVFVFVCFVFVCLCLFCFVCLCLCVTQCFPVFRCPTACGIAVRQWKPYTERNSVYYVHIVHSLSAPLNICIRPMMMLRDMFATIFVAQRGIMSSPPFMIWMQTWQFLVNSLRWPADGS